MAFYQRYNIQSLVDGSSTTVSSSISETEDFFFCFPWWELVWVFNLLSIYNEHVYYLGSPPVCVEPGLFWAITAAQERVDG